MTVRTLSSSFNPVYQTNPETGNLTVEIVDTTNGTGNGNPTTSSNIKATTAPTKTPIPSSTSSVLVLPSNINRVFAFIRNDSTSVAYIELDTIATLTSAYKLDPGGIMTFDNYTGPLSVIWVTANGFLRVSEGV